MEQFLQIFLAVCGGIITTAGAGTVIYHIYKALRQPDTERDIMMKEHEKKLETCGKRLDGVESGQAVLMEAVLAIMNHLIDGEHMDDLKTASSKMQGYLIGQRTDVLRDDKTH